MIKGEEFEMLLRDEAEKLDVTVEEYLEWVEDNYNILANQQVNYG
jgi:hypothetical protein